MYLSCNTLMFSVTLSLLSAQPVSRVTDSATEVQSKAYSFSGGRWFDGSSFVEKTVYCEKGTFRSTPPETGFTEINLNGGFAVPPFAEAHNHNVDGRRETIDRYLAHGIFYAKNPNCLPAAMDAELEALNHPTSLDATFAHGSITATDGHPVEIWQRNVARGVWTSTHGEGAFFWQIDDVEGLDAKWPRILEGHPDFIKTYLLYAEEYDVRKDDKSYLGWKGLNPNLLPEIVVRAHNAGLQVSTHVETAADFHYALAAKVDEVNHLPGFRIRPNVDLSRYVIDETDARAAGSQGMVVVTTLVGLVPPKVREIQKTNLTLLKRHGVTLAVGSDAYDLTALAEARQLARLGFVSKLELLKMWCEDTPHAIFPERKIGKLENGYEASFLVLEGNPLDDFNNCERIKLRFKQGFPLEVNEQP